ncbi:MAG: hypothetical protein AAF402_11565 [Pseudomonadota bacterium]
MEEKRQDLKVEKQRRFLETVVARLADENPSFYYLPTVEVAIKIEAYLEEPGNLSNAERELTQGLDRRQIQILLSVRHD